ncbi:MAG: hypothetical protein QXI60_08480 [Thermofilaceae archaeon]
MRSRSESGEGPELDFEKSKALLYALCEACRIPYPSVKQVDAVGYEGEQVGLEVRLRSKNSPETVIHEWLHYVFELVHLEKLRWSDSMDEHDNYEHRVILFLEPILGEYFGKAYKRAAGRGKRGKG